MSSLFSQKPGGLSINTGSANSLFSSNNTNVSQAPPPPAAGGLFGSSTVTSKPDGGLFGSSTSTAASAGTLFSTSTATAKPGTSLFSNAASAPASNAGTLFGGAAASQGGGLFGQSKPQTSQPAASGGLFGQSTQQNTGGSLFSNTQSQQQAGNLFGGTTTSQPQAGGGLFGPSTNQQIQPQGGSGLFGSLGQTTQPQPVGGTFGQPQNNPNTSIFGAGTAQPTQNTQKPNFAQTNSTLFPSQNPQRSAFSASIGQYTAAAQTIPGVRIDLSNLRSTTRFEDLQESLQKEISDLDTFILNQIQLSDECSSVLPRVDELARVLPSDVEYLERKLKAGEQSLQTDAASIEEGRSLVKADAEDARRSFKAIHALKMPAQFHVSGPWSSSVSGAAGAALADEEAVDGDKQSADLVRYFSNQAEDMESKLEIFKKNLGEVESYLAGIEARTIAKIQTTRMGQPSDVAPKSADEKVRELASVLREFEGGILNVAGSVGGVRESAQEVMLTESKHAGRWGGRR